MIKKLILLFLLCLELSALSQQEKITVEQVEVTPKNNGVTYHKSIKNTKDRSFKNDLKSKYSGKEFIYKDNIKKKKKEPKKINFSNTNFFKGVGNFMTNVFPYLLALIVIFILVKSFLNTEGNLFKFGKRTKKVIEKLVYEEDENIENNDYDKLLAQAINNNNYRLATRYYYLSVLKKLSQKSMIDYHKDKTNSEYLFELKNKETRKAFSYLSYLYNYVWYGKFPINKTKFTIIESNYKSFINKL